MGLLDKWFAKRDRRFRALKVEGHLHGQEKPGVVYLTTDYATDMRTAWLHLQIKSGFSLSPHSWVKFESSEQLQAFAEELLEIKAIMDAETVTYKINQGVGRV